VDEVALGISKIAATFYPEPVIIRFSDFKTNEYRTLLGGELYEPHEENPMLGWRGASRYYDPKFKTAFGLECKAMKKVREEMGFTNVIPMIPFCRTPEEGKQVVNVMLENGLDRSKDASLKIYVMCEIPSNILLADEFLEVFDGMSIGSNDLTQLTLGLDRDSGIVTHIANENNPAVKKLISQVIKKCKEKSKYIGICGQAPSDYPDFARFLVSEGIESMSLNPDTVIKIIMALGEEAKKS
jgi:pyruvate,water dikinase